MDFVENRMSHGFAELQIGKSFRTAHFADDVGGRMKVSSDGAKWEVSSVSSLADVAFRATPSGGELDLWGEWWKKTGPWQIDGIAWRVHVRVQIRPGGGLPDVRLVQILNNGVKTLKVACASFVFGRQEFSFALPDGGVCLNPGDGQSHFS